MQREDHPNTKQLCSKNRTESDLRNSTADIRLCIHPPFLLSLSRFSHSYVIPDLCWPPAFPKQLAQIQTSPKRTLTHVYTHRETLCFHRLKAWERCVVSTLLVPGTKTSRGFPSLVLQEGRCSCVGVLEMFGLHGTGSILLPFIVTDWAWTHTPPCSQKIKHVEEWENLG